MDVTDVWSLPEGEYTIAACRKMRVMLVSRSCDIDKQARKHFLVAPVQLVADLKDEQRTEEKLRDLRANDILHWFYLPALEPGLPEAFADMTMLVPLHRSFFDEEVLRTKLVARLSSEGSAALQKSLSEYYGARFGFAWKDTCPQTATYACAACFHSGIETPQRKGMVEKTVFGPCERCGEAALWVKLPQ